MSSTAFQIGWKLFLALKESSQAREPPINARSVRFNENVNECKIDFTLRKTNPNQICEEIVSELPTKLQKLEGRVESTLDILNNMKEEQDQSQQDVIIEMQNINAQSQR